MIAWVQHSCELGIKYMCWIFLYSFIMTTYRSKESGPEEM